MIINVVRSMYPNQAQKSSVQPPAGRPVPQKFVLSNAMMITREFFRVARMFDAIDINVSWLLRNHAVIIGLKLPCLGRKDIDYCVHMLDWIENNKQIQQYSIRERCSLVRHYALELLLQVESLLSLSPQESILNCKGFTYRQQTLKEEEIEILFHEKILKNTIFSKYFHHLHKIKQDQDHKYKQQEIPAEQESLYPKLQLRPEDTDISHDDKENMNTHNFLYNSESSSYCNNNEKKRDSPVESSNQVKEKNEKNKTMKKFQKHNSKNSTQAPVHISFNPDSFYPRHHFFQISPGIQHKQYFITTPYLVNEMLYTIATLCETLQSLEHCETVDMSEFHDTYNPIPHEEIKNTEKIVDQSVHLLHILHSNYALDERDTIEEFALNL